MTVQEALREGYLKLKQAHVETPFLDATLLLSEACACSKEQLYRWFGDDLVERIRPDSEATAYELYNGFLKLRCRGMPVSYIRQKKEFFGIEFKVDERVFVPRPDTECLIETSLAIVDRIAQDRTARSEGPVSVHDVCTGSGCIAITMKHERPSLTISASDLSESAAELFEINSRLILGEIIPFTVADLLEGVAGPFDLIISNPPYLSSEAAAAMRHSGWPEPLIALDGGQNGTELPVELIRQAAPKLSRPGELVLEADPHQMAPLAGAMRDCGFDDIKVVEDLAGRERVLTGRID
jgi:release factor glutamine methyltransferase